jgi:hypothetical protein
MHENKFSPLIRSRMSGQLFLSHASCTVDILALSDVPVQSSCTQCNGIQAGGNCHQQREDPQSTMKPRFALRALATLYFALCLLTALAFISLLTFCEVFGRIPSLLCNALVVARQPLVEYFHGYSRHPGTVVWHGKRQ